MSFSLWNSAKLLENSIIYDLGKYQQWGGAVMAALLSLPHLAGSSKSLFIYLFINLFIIFFTHLFIFERQRETEHEQAKGSERGRHRSQRRLQALSRQHRAWCGARTHKPWDHDLSQSGTPKRLSHPGAPWVKQILSVYAPLCKSPKQYFALYDIN